MQKTNSILNNWFFVSATGGITGFLLSMLFIGNWKVAVIIAIVIFIIIISYNPKRRYLKAFYFVLALLVTLNKFFFQLIGHFSGLDIHIGSDKLNTATNASLIGLAALCLYLDFKERNRIKKADRNGLSEFIPKEGYINEPQYILDEPDSGIDSLNETKRELEKLIENYKLQIIEHKAEIKKIKIPLRRLEENLDFVNDEIKSIRNQSTDE